MIFKKPNNFVLFSENSGQKECNTFFFFLLQEELYGERIAFYYRMNTVLLTSLEHCGASAITVQM